MDVFTWFFHVALVGHLVIERKSSARLIPFSLFTCPRHIQTKIGETSTRHP